MKTFIQKLGKSLMGPLSIIVAAGLLLGLASTLQNPNVFGNVLQDVAFVNNFVSLVNALAGALFGLLPILFCMSVAQGMSREDREVATFASIIGFALFHTTIRFFLSLKGITADTVSIDYLMGQGYSLLEATQQNAAYDTVMVIFTYRMSIFGGIIVGLWTAMIHNRFHETQLPVAFSFFSGKRFVPIMMVVTIPFLGLLMFFVWPVFNVIINGFGHLLASAGAFGTFIYGFLERLLIPTGLHHILNQLIRFTPIGGTAEIDGQQVSGALNIFNTLLMQQNPDMDVMRQATRFLTQGTHPFMVFGLPAACYAMYKTAYPQNREKAKGILLAAGLTSFFTGITEPIEFSFIFISPLLWVFHAFMAGTSFLINTFLGVCIGNAGGGLVDLMLFGVLRGPQTKWILNVAVGLVYAVIYYNVFKWAIVKFNIKTPGREDESDAVDYNEEITELGAAIMEALGGKENIVEIDNCISRLRLILKDSAKVNEKALKATGSLGLIRINEENVQVVYGAKVEKAAAELKRAVKKAGGSAAEKHAGFEAPVAGTLIPITEVKDTAFSQKMVGDGFAIIPESDTVYAPWSGTVAACFETNHAVGIVTENGDEVLIHIGIDTVKLKGEGFKTFVKQGQKVKQGEKLITFDRELIQSKGFDPVVILIFPNKAVNVNAAHQNLKEHQGIDVKIN